MPRRRDLHHSPGPCARAAVSAAATSSIFSISRSAHRLWCSLAQLTSTWLRAHGRERALHAQRADVDVGDDDDDEPQRDDAVPRRGVLHLLQRRQIGRQVRRQPDQGAERN